MKMNFSLKVTSFGIKNGDNVATVLADTVKVTSDGVIVSHFKGDCTSVCEYNPNTVTLNRDQMTVHDKNGKPLTFIIRPVDGKSLIEALFEIALLTGFNMAMENVPKCEFIVMEDCSSPFSLGSEKLVDILEKISQNFSQ